MSVVIVSAARTPIGAFQGVFTPLSAPKLGGLAVKEAVSRSGCEPADVDLVIMGNVLTAGEGQAPARQASMSAGIPNSVPAYTINKVCGSGMESIIQAHRAIATDDAGLVIAGGMESMTNAPYLLANARSGLRLGHGKVLDSMIHDGLWDPYGDMHMGSCAELCASRYEFSREQQEEFAIASYERSQAAQRQDCFRDELFQVDVPWRRGEITAVTADESPQRADFEKLRKLPAAFEQQGTITAGTASSISDGAAAVAVCSEATARSKGLPVLARIVGYAGHANAPEWFTIAPIGAINTLLGKVGWTLDDVDLFEINEAFAVVTMAAIKELGLPPDRVNVHGGAVALGHPIGASGTRIVVTLINALRQRGQRRGIASICIGGGEALALAVEVGA